MNRLLLLTILIFSLSVSASISSKNNYYTSLCIEDESTGFNWVDGKWSLANFNNSKYIVKRFPLSKSPICDVSKAAHNDVRTYGCYNKKKLGQEFGIFSYQLCTEFWESGKLSKVSCSNSVWGDNIEFQPSGIFHTSKIDRTLKYKDSKGSMYVSHGKCSTL
jgi:hypothetical protein